MTNFSNVISFDKRYHHRVEAKKVFLCDSEKFDTNSAYKQCSLSDVDFLISESEEAKKFSKHSNSLKIL